MLKPRTYSIIDSKKILTRADLPKKEKVKEVVILENPKIEEIKETPKQPEVLYKKTIKKNIEKVFYTVTNEHYFSGTIATINSIRLFYPNDLIYIFEEKSNPLNDIQTKYLSEIQNLVFIKYGNLDIGNIKQAWQTKAHAAFYLQKQFINKKDILIHLDSDLVICNHLSIFINETLNKDVPSGGKDGKGVDYDSKYNPYIKLCNSKINRSNTFNTNYMSSSILLMPINEKYLEICKLWSNAVDEAKFGPDTHLRNSIYEGYGDQGILNAILYFKEIIPNILDNDITSEHWVHGKTKVLFNNKFLKNNKECYSFHSVGDSPKFWTEDYPNFVKKCLKNELEEVFDYWLWLVYLGPVGVNVVNNPSKIKILKSMIFGGNDSHYNIFINKNLNKFNRIITIEEETFELKDSVVISKIDKEYDIEICVPLCGKSQYSKRINNFKKYGIQNIKNNKVLLSLLVGNEQIENIDKNWPCDIKILTSNTDKAAEKIYSYYLNLNKEECSKVKWFMRVDDDSMTDIDGILKNLDYEFDYKKEYHLMADPCYDINPKYKEIAQNLGYEYWSNKKVSSHRKHTFTHEWEASVSSQKAILNIIQNDNCKQLFTKAIESNGGQGDHCLALAARMCKIHPVDCIFMTKDPALEDFSIFEGRFNHIHFIKEEAPQWNTFLEKINVNKNTFNTDENIYNNLKGKIFTFGKVGGNPWTDKLKLGEDGKIKNYVHDNEHSWDVVNGKLRFKTINGSISCEFTTKDNIHYRGKFLLNGNDFNILKLNS
jgi:hypothetical protein